MVAALAVALGRRPGWSWTIRQRVSFVGGLAVLAVALSWPIADLASHWSLLALVLQRMLLLLAAPPLLLLGLPRDLLARLTQPAPVDLVVRTVTRPPVAVGIVTVVAVGTLTVGAVDEQASSSLFRAALDLLLLGAGFVLWAPVLRVVPGARRLSSFGRASYLVVQSIVPSFLSLVWIFARRPLYSAFDHGQHVAGMAPLLDQQLSGFVAKFLTIAVLWTVAFVQLNRGRRADDGADDEPLTWADVSRELARAERREQRTARVSRWRPPP